MNKHQRERYGRFVAFLCEHSPPYVNGTNGVHPWRDADTLRRIGRNLSRLNERQCNEPMDDAMSARVEKRWDRLAADAGAIVAPYGLICKAQGDPRGYSLSLFTPDQHAESATGYGVPEE